MSYSKIITLKKQILKFGGLKLYSPKSPTNHECKSKFGCESYDFYKSVVKTWNSWMWVLNKKLRLAKSVYTNNMSIRIVSLILRRSKRCEW